MVLTFSSCTKYDEPSVRFTREDWYTVKTDNGGSIHLIIEGTTNADKLTITSYGDGLIGDDEIDIKWNNHFKADVCISFMITSRPLSGKVVSSTELKAYKKENMITLKLKSDTLTY